MKGETTKEKKMKNTDKRDNEKRNIPEWLEKLLNDAEDAPNGNDNQ